MTSASNSDPGKQPKNDPDNSEQDQIIIDQLRADPGFFVRHPGLLSELDLPHNSGSAVSLIERQVAILRERNMQMRRRMNELLQAAKDNDQLFAKTRTLTLELLNVDSWQELNEVLATFVLADFQADFVCAHLAGHQIYLDHLQSHDGPLPHELLVSGTRPVCSILRVEELAALFPIQQHDSEGSAVIAPLFWEGGRGALAIGSRDPSRFSSDMDTLFVTYIGEVTSRVCERLTT